MELIRSGTPDLVWISALVPDLFFWGLCDFRILMKCRVSIKNDCKSRKVLKLVLKRFGFC